ncbi:MAG: Ldh family oxidoreductase [Chloroflexi bacterium]|nr:Ldh family oxidoreductase [Chloroflexota bacterium]
MNVQSLYAAAHKTVALEPLRTSLERALEADGMPRGHAVQTADVLLDAELRGYDDHGVFFLGEIHKWFKSGALNPSPNIRVVHETDSSLVLDGDRGSAVAASFQAIHWCVEHARAHGIATAGIRNSGHFVAAAPFPTWAARQGFIAMAAANVVPLMPAPGGRTKTLGTNPFCFAAPTGLDYPLVFDMATSAIAGFKARILAQQGKSVPEGLVMNAEGRPTTDPGDLDRGGSLAPVGGYKGFGLALMVEVLAGVLTGAQFGQNAGVVNGKEGHFFLVLDPEIFMPRAEFTARMDELLRWVKSGQTIEGVNEIVYPGERGQRRAATLTAEGRVPLDAVAWRTLETVCGELGVPLPS